MLSASWPSSVIVLAGEFFFIFVLFYKVGFVNVKLTRAMVHGYFTAVNINEFGAESPNFPPAQPLRKIRNSLLVFRADVMIVIVLFAVPAPSAIAPSHGASTVVGHSVRVSLREDLTSILLTRHSLGAPVS